MNGLPRGLLEVLVVAAMLAVLSQNAFADKLVNTTTEGQQRWPSVGMADDGRFVVAWSSNHQTQVGAYDVMLQMYTSASQKVNGEIRVNTYWPEDQEFAQVPVAMDNNGNFVVVWSSIKQAGDPLSGIFGQRYDSNGETVGDEFHINTYTDGSQTFPDVAMTGGGDFVVTWESLQGYPGGDVYARRYNADGTPVNGNEFLINQTIAGCQLRPGVVIDDDGNFVVAWESNQLGDYDVYARHCSWGLTCGDEFCVNTCTDDHQREVAIGMEDDGSFVVGWHSLNQVHNYDVFAQRFDDDCNPVGGEFRVNAYTQNAQGDPSVAMTDEGEFVFVWTSENQGDGDMQDIYSRRYDGDGSVIIDEYRVNDYTDSIQASPAVAVEMACNGNYVVTWESLGQDGEGYGIYMQLHDSLGNPIPEPGTILMILGGLAGLTGIVRRRK